MLLSNFYSRQVTLFSQDDGVLRLVILVPRRSGGTFGDTQHWLCSCGSEETSSRRGPSITEPIQVGFRHHGSFRALK